MAIKPTIYCIMITGKTPIREKFAEIAIENFKQQTYENKHLIIINHGDFDLLSKQNITEYKVEPQFIGKLRNIGLSYVPEGGIWTCWDDDDWRHPSLLEYQYNTMLDNNKKGSILTRQVQYAFSINSAWIQEWYRISGTIMYTKDNLTYNTKWCMPGEDVIFLRKIDPKQIFRCVNPSYYYLRFIHNDNSCFERDDHFSLKDRDHNLFKIDEASKTYLKTILKEHYHEFILMG